MQAWETYEFHLTPETRVLCVYPERMNAVLNEPVGICPTMPSIRTKGMPSLLPPLDKGRGRGGVLPLAASTGMEYARTEWRRADELKIGMQFPDLGDDLHDIQQVSQSESHFIQVQTARSTAHVYSGCHVLACSSLEYSKDHKPLRPKLARTMRKNMSPPEVVLWLRMKGMGDEVRFRRQHPIGPYFADFCSVRAMVVVEVDGEQHFEQNQQKHDEERDEFLRRTGFVVLRYSGAEVFSKPDSVISDILLAIHSRMTVEFRKRRWTHANCFHLNDRLLLPVSGKLTASAVMETSHCNLPCVRVTVSGYASMFTDLGVFSPCLAV